MQNEKSPAIEQEPTMTKAEFEVWEKANKFIHESEKAKIKNNIADSIRLEYAAFKYIKTGVDINNTDTIETLQLILENVFKALKRNGIELER